MLIEGVVSGWEMVRSGVPQSSVLFVVFIDDIDVNIHSTGILLSNLGVLTISNQPLQELMVFRPGF